MAVTHSSFAARFSLWEVPASGFPTSSYQVFLLKATTRSPRSLLVSRLNEPNSLTGQELHPFIGHPAVYYFWYKSGHNTLGTISQVLIEKDPPFQSDQEIFHLCCCKDLFLIHAVVHWDLQVLFCKTTFQPVLTIPALLYRIVVSQVQF